MGKRANVRCAIVRGTLKGFDALMNLVLDDVDEVMRGMYYSHHIFGNRVCICGD